MFLVFIHATRWNDHFNQQSGKPEMLNLSCMSRSRNNAKKIVRLKLLYIGFHKIFEVDVDLRTKTLSKPYSSYQQKENRFVFVPTSHPENTFVSVLHFGLATSRRSRERR